MNAQELYRLLELPAEVAQRLMKETLVVPQEITDRYLSRPTSGEGLKQLTECVGEDPDGLGMLYVLLNMALTSWQKYEAAGISQTVFVDTMKFVTRTLREHREQRGTYEFHKAWWFWRELCMEEFRLGCLEYEMVPTDEGKVISIHIPSDADLRPEAVDQSFAAFRAFAAQFYPDWQEAKWICDSWMMCPALRELLPETSNILRFQGRFDTVKVSDDTKGVLEWVFPPHTEISENLPENTSLQRRMKAYLLGGGLIGWTKAELKA